MAERDVVLVRRGFEAFTRGDVAAALELLDPGIEWVTSDELPTGGRRIGRDEVAASWAQIPDFYDELRFETESFLDAGTSVVVIGRQVVRGKGVQETTRAPFCAIFDMAGGRATRMRMVSDTAKVLRALASTPTPTRA